jgi:GT2 family glycosyltransferase
MDCLNAIKSNTQEGSYEVIVVDNGSNPPFQCPAWKNFTYIRNESNLGFPVAVNMGIRAASGDTIVLLNNDVIVTPGWERLWKHHLHNYSIVSPMTNYCAGLQRVTIPVYNNESELNQQALNFQIEQELSSQEVNWIIGFCMAFKKSLWEEIGPFDESLWPCSGEEIQFCLESRKRGYKVGVCKDVYLHHVGSVTLTDLEQSGQLVYMDICNRNDKHIAELYGKDWINQLVERSE